jgi:hypothetical protein
MGLIHRPMKRDRSCLLPRFLAGCDSERYGLHNVTDGDDCKARELDKYLGSDMADWPTLALDIAR